MRRVFRDGRLLPALLGFAALALVVVAVVVATGGDDDPGAAALDAKQVEPVDNPGPAAERSGRERREEPKSRQEAEPVPQSPPDPPGNSQQSSADGTADQGSTSAEAGGEGTRRGREGEDKGVSCAEQRRARESVPEEYQGYLRQWFGPGCK